MSTKSIIGLRAENELIRYITCDFDGAPHRAGATLLEHYQEPEKVSELLDLGDLSALGQEIGAAHDFNYWLNRDKLSRAELDLYNAMCLAYGRDNEQSGKQARVCLNRFDFYLAAKAQYVDFIYLYETAKAKWVYTQVRNNRDDCVLFDILDSEACRL